MGTSPINDSERLGRQVSDGSKAKKAAGGKFTPKIFMPNSKGDRVVSLDRLDMAPLLNVAKIAFAHATAIRKTFYGWANVRARFVRENGRTVEHVPELGNEYHSEVYYPLKTCGKNLTELQLKQWNEEAKEHAIDLALSAEWQPWP